MKTISNEMLVANAGSGKTYSLTTRMVTLLAHGVEPRKIAALTFTRKAAGEFLDAVFARLARAALEPDKLDALRRDTGLPSLDAAGCRAILQRLVDQMGGLCMGTIDSLFARIMRAFPLEAGLTGEFAILGEGELEASREEALAGLFRYYAKDDAGFRNLLDLVRQQSRRQGEREVFSLLLHSIASLHAKFLQTPENVTWGRADLIWPAGSAILSAPAPDVAAGALWQAISETHPGLSPEAADAWQQNLALAGSLLPGESWSPELADFIKRRLCSCSVDKATGEAYVPTGRTKDARVYLNGRVGAAREALLNALLRPEFEALLRRSRALHGLMKRFEAIYHLSTREQGRLTFDDITNLLSRQIEDPAWQAVAGYRLDARYDHWLLDEFQDTSRPQWKVLGSFIDEVIQDASGSRSLFYVGDTKQAIYLWRGGDPALFFEIRDTYNASDPNRIVENALTESYRSAPEIIETVNRIFGDIGAVAEPLGLPERAAEDWARAWRGHSVAAPNKGQSGYVRWISPAAAEDDDEDADPQDREILKILLESEPWGRGLRCAVLKRDNKKVAALAALLQARGIPVAVEGKSNPCTDNPIGAALLAGCRLVASPDDRLSAALFAGFPLGAALLAGGEEGFRSDALEVIAAKGYANLLREWIPDLSTEPFLASRAAEFVAAATAFDKQRSPSDGLYSFLDFIETRQVQESGGADVVRVMTVHQAKGLTFDMTIVSGIDPLVKDRTAGSLALGRRNGETAWGMLLPSKDFSTQDPELRAAREDLLAQSAYGELCTAYVALTRPRLGLYILTKSAGKTSKGFARLLTLTLGACGEGFERGNPQWFEAFARPAESGAEVESEEVSLAAPVTGTPRPQLPSDGHERSDVEAEGHFAPGGARIGTAVHAALARISWLNEGRDPDFDSIPKEARSLVAGFLQTSAAKKLFSRPSEPCWLWREQPFDVLIGGRWVSGVFDRVQVGLDSDGRPVAAVIYDFKTDRLSGGRLEERYAGQLAAYQQAGAQLLGLAESAVSAEVVAVRVED